MPDGPLSLFDINPNLPRAALADQFAANRRVQVRDVLTDEAAHNLHSILARGTNWGLAWHAGTDGPHNVPKAQLDALGEAERGAIHAKLTAALSGTEYGFAYAQYPMVKAYLDRWEPGGAHEAIVELINDEPLLSLVREVTRIPALIKADAQATLYAPTQFLAAHDDSHVAEGWRVAYVLNLCAQDWRPEWGGYLNFYDAYDDIVQGFRPRFNALNLFRVPQRHSVSYVPPFAPVGRFAITGWFRDR